MKKSLLGVFALALTLSLIFAAALHAQGGSPLDQKSIDRITKEVRHELVMLPFYGVFDNLAYKVDADGTVTLLGEVSRPVLKSDAEAVVKKIEGVTNVVNNIEVLPTSITDDASAAPLTAPSTATRYSASISCERCRPFTSS